MFASNISFSVWPTNTHGVLRTGAVRGRRHGLSDLFAAGCPVHKEALRAPCACWKIKKELIFQFLFC